MHFSSSLTKSFKSHSSYKHRRRISAEEYDPHEQKPILSDHQPKSGSPEVIVRIDSADDNPVSEDSKVGEMSLDVNLEMDDSRHDSRNPQNVQHVKNNSYNDSSRNSNNLLPISKEPRVSFHAQNLFDKSPEEDKTRQKQNSVSSNNNEIPSRRRSSMFMSNDVHTQNNNGGRDESRVLKCTSIRGRANNLGRLKTRSRFDDQPPVAPEKKSGVIKSNQIRASGMLGKPNGDDDEDDPLFGEELPDDFHKVKFDAIIIAEWISLVLIMSALGLTLAFSEWRRKNFRGLSLWNWEVLVFVLICGRLVSGWGIRIVVFFIERSFVMRKRVLYFVYGVRKAVRNCLWLGLVFIAWHFMFNQKVEGTNEFLQYVDRIMLCMLMSSFLWLLKTLLVKVLASSFHVSTFFDRIQESLFNQYVIETLSGPPLMEIQHNQDEDEKTMAEIRGLQNAGAVLPPDLSSTAFHSAKSGKVIGNTKSFKVSGQLAKSGGQDGQGISIDSLNRLNHKNVCAWNMQRLMNVVRNGALSTMDERVVGYATDSEAATEIRSEFEAIAAARKIFRNVAQPTAKFIYLKDLMCFLGEEEALKTMNLVEGSAESEKISKASLKSWVVNTFRERRALALTLNDTKTAVKKLHQMVNIIVGIIIVIMCLIILEIATSKILLLVSSQIVVVAFIFGNSCKTAFEAIIFVFVMHPFDVGDRCEIDGIQMIVEEMNILTTVFLRYDNQKIIYPNVTLATKPISNYYRSPDMGDSVDFVVHITTPAEKIGIIKDRITRFVEEKSDHWYPSPSVVLMNFEGLKSLKLSVWLRHKINHQDMGEKWKRRALVVEEMVKIFKELDIEYRLHPIDINVRSTATNVTSSRVPAAWIPPSSN